jgi:hypothetical protein
VKTTLETVAGTKSPGGKSSSQAAIPATVAAARYGQIIETSFVTAIF